MGDTRLYVYYCHWANNWASHYYTCQ